MLSSNFYQANYWINFKKEQNFIAALDIQSQFCYTNFSKNSINCQLYIFDSQAHQSSYFINEDLIKLRRKLSSEARSAFTTKMINGT